MKKVLQETKIDWCDVTWNPVWGCLNHCSYCYARRIAKRWGKAVCGRNDFYPTWVENNYQKEFPATPSLIFVNSMSDFEHWQLSWIKKVIEKIADHPEHIFMFLSKHPGNYNIFDYGFPRNVWLGATATTEFTVELAIADLLETKRMYGVHTFLSIEPIHERISRDLLTKHAIDWLIVGAETGGRKGRIIPEAEWIEELRACDMPVFFKKNIHCYYPYKLPRMWPGVIQKIKRGEKACHTLSD